MRNSTLIDVYILEILEKHANEKHRLIQKDIIRYLAEDYDVKVHRNTLRTYLDELREHNYIRGERGVYKVNKFDDRELRLLIDGVLFGQHIPPQDARKLIDKLKGMSELGLKERVKNIHYVEGMNRTQNQRLYEIIDTIDEAIQKNRKLNVGQCKYFPDKQLKPTGRSLTVHPYQLVTEKSRYYLICYVEPEGSPYHGKDMENLRIDRFSSVEILDEPAMDVRKVPGYENGFRLDDYMKEHIYMWSGKSTRVTLRIKTYNIGDFIDWFGTDFTVRKQAEDYMEVSIIVNEQAIKYWALQYSRLATVIKPKELRDEIRQLIEEMQESYKNE